MHEKDRKYFELLKQKIVAVIRISYPGINPSIADWKGQEISDFQEELRIKVNANISEKWFYTHMKSDQASLPRIDMLNILSQFAGYANWNEFIHKNSVTEDIRNRPFSSNRYFIIVPVIAVAVIIIFFGLYLLFNTRSYRFMILDADTRDPITGQKTEIQVLFEGESPMTFFALEDGSFRYRTDKSKIRLVIRSPYYLPDTITRIVTKLQGDEVILLRPDEYAMMLHYFSTMRVDDWQKRRNKLNEMIADSAMICQVMSDGNETGMALLNKEEFINRLTVPSGNLKNIDILGTRSKEGKIVSLKFRIKETRK